MSKSGTQRSIQEAVQEFVPVMLRLGITEKEGIALIQILGGTKSQLTALRNAFRVETEKGNERVKHALSSQSVREYYGFRDCDKTTGMVETND